MPFSIMSPKYENVSGAFNWIMKQAKPGDRIVLELTNTLKEHTFTIPLRK